MTSKQPKYSEPSTDQAHVMVKRQPTDENVRLGNAYLGADAADVGQQVGVRKHNSLRRSCATGGVLQHGDRFRGRRTAKWL